MVGASDLSSTTVGAVSGVLLASGRGSRKRRVLTSGCPSGASCGAWSAGSWCSCIHSGVVLYSCIHLNSTIHQRMPGRLCKGRMQTSRFVAMVGASDFSQRKQCVSKKFFPSRGGEKFAPSGATPGVRVKSGLIPKIKIFFLIFFGFLEVNRDGRSFLHIAPCCAD